MVTLGGNVTYVAHALLSFEFSSLQMPSLNPTASLTDRTGVGYLYEFTLIYHIYFILINLYITNLIFSSSNKLEMILFPQFQLKFLNNK